MVQSVLLEKAAELLGVSRRTIYYRIRDGRLRTVRTVGGSQRVLIESIEVLLRAEQGARGHVADASDTGACHAEPSSTGSATGGCGRCGPSADRNVC